MLTFAIVCAYACVCVSLGVVVSAEQMRRWNSMKPKVEARSDAIGDRYMDSSALWFLYM